MTTINKNYEIDNIQILGDLDLLLKNPTPRTIKWCSV